MNRNNVQKKEFPGRGSFICHLATEHGKILDVMRADSDVDMSPVIELLTTYDKQFREFVLTGTKTDADDDLVSVKESPYWRLLNRVGEKKEKVEEAANESTNSPQSVATERSAVAEVNLPKDTRDIPNIGDLPKPKDTRDIPNTGVSDEKAVSDSTKDFSQHGSTLALPTDPANKNQSKDVGLKVGQSRKKKGSKRKKSDSSEDSLTSGSDTSDDDGEASGEDSDDGDSGKDKLSPVSGQTNTSYVRKRRRGKISLDSGDDDDESDAEWDDGGKNKKRQKRRRKEAKVIKREPLSSADEDDPVTVIASRPPKRAAAAKAVVKQEPDYLSDEGEV